MPSLSLIFKKVSGLFLNPYNWLALLRIFFVIENPLKFVLAIISRNHSSVFDVRTPIGMIRVEMRNYESLRTLFSTFCREDYHLSASSSFSVMDCGANVGIASLYFLSRNTKNMSVCFEPDRANTDFLKRNLNQFADRVIIYEKALATEAGSSTLFRAEDGKYSSLIPSEKANQPDLIECIKFEKALEYVVTQKQPVVVKLDVEGLELDLVKSIDWQRFPEVKHIISESTGCSAAIARPHTQSIRSGFVEHIHFDGIPSFPS